MRNLFRIGVLSISLTVLLTLTSCKGSEPDKTEQQGNASVVESLTTETIKPKLYYKASAEKRLVQLEQHLKETYNGAAASLYYQYNYADLDEDLSNELLIWLNVKSEVNSKDIVHQFIIMDEQFNTIFKSNMVTAPITVLTQRTNGWFDIACFKEKSQYKVIKMSNKGYMLQQYSNENVIEFDQIEGICYLSNATNEIGFQIK